VAASVAVIVSMCGLAVFSEDSKAPPAAKPLSSGRTSGSAPRTSQGVIVRAKSIAGMAVKNPANEDLGKVEDVVIDMETGSVRYAAITFSGFLGVGDKLFAVPFRSLHVKQDAGSKTSHFVLDVEKKTLEKARGFDKSDWPDFANPRFSEENDRYFAEPARVTR
jgi:sporulation protein YlmC with PRC-barrel domain